MQHSVQPVVQERTQPQRLLCVRRAQQERIRQCQAPSQSRFAYFALQANSVKMMVHQAINHAKTALLESICRLRATVHHWNASCVRLASIRRLRALARYPRA